MERRTAKELILLHKLEPTLRDVVVEGEYDQRIFAWFLGDSAKVWHIGQITVDDGTIISMGRKANNRERVIYLAELAFEAGINGMGLLCIADRDFDDFVPARNMPPTCEFTDYTCIEMYAWEESVIEHFLKVFCGRTEPAGTEMLDAIKGPLQELFAIRLVGEHKSVMLDWIECDRCMSLEGSQFVLNRNEFINRLMNKSRCADRLNEFQTEVPKILASFGSDPRFQIHGHDFTTLLGFALKSYGVQRQFHDVIVVAHGLAASVTSQQSHLGTHRLFQRLTSFITTG